MFPFLSVRLSFSFCACDAGCFKTFALWPSTTKKANKLWRPAFPPESPSQLPRRSTLALSQQSAQRLSFSLGTVEIHSFQAASSSSSSLQFLNSSKVAACRFLHYHFSLLPLQFQGVSRWCRASLGRFWIPPLLASSAILRSSSTV